MSDQAKCAGSRVIGFGIVLDCSKRDSCQRYRATVGDTQAWLPEAPFQVDRMARTSCEAYVGDLE